MKADGGRQKSQARASLFLVVFLLLVPTTLALGYAGTITGNPVLGIGQYPMFDASILQQPENGQQQPIPTMPEARPADLNPAYPTQEQQSQATEPMTDEAAPENGGGPPPENGQAEPWQEAQQPVNPCAGISCQEPGICPDGYNAGCASACDPLNGQCGSCTPNCSGHGAAQNQSQLGQQNQSCSEDWNCSGWSDCTGGMQSRACTDANACGNENTKPESQRTCVAGACNVTCSPCWVADEANCSCIPLESCISGDSCCPPSCTYETDADCPRPGCLSDSECDDSVACTTDTCANRTCAHSGITPCCGNGVCENGESHYGCQADCKKPDEPEFSVTVDRPEKVTRGTTVQFSATITNAGKGPALSVSPFWMLPEGMQLIASLHDCANLLPDSSCKATAQVYVAPGLTGRQEIRMLIDYA